jgi:hypothetical protein
VLTLCLPYPCFKNFESESIIVQQSTDEASAPYRVEINGGSIQSGTTGSAFVNDGGELQISDFSANDVTAMSLFSTANGGATFIQDTTIAGGQMQVRFLSLS